MKRHHCTACADSAARATECLGLLNATQARIVDLEAALNAVLALKEENRRDTHGWIIHARTLLQS